MFLGLIRGLSNSLDKYERNPENEFSSVSHTTLPIDEIRNAFGYDPETGIITYKHNPTKSHQWNRTWVNRPLGTVRNRYVIISYAGHNLRAHRLAWALHTGAWPTDLIDHVDGDPTNNRISNLREANAQQNARNRRRQARTKSGFKGVYAAQNLSKPWQALIKVDNRLRYLGAFETPEEAHAVWCDAAQLHYGEFAHDGNSPMLPN